MEITSACVRISTTTCLHSKRWSVCGKIRRSGQRAASWPFLEWVDLARTMRMVTLNVRNNLLHVVSPNIAAMCGISLPSTKPKMRWSELAPSLGWTRCQRKLHTLGLQGKRARKSCKSCSVSIHHPSLFSYVTLSKLHVWREKGRYIGWVYTKRP